MRKRLLTVKLERNIIAWYVHVLQEVDAERIVEEKVSKELNAVRFLPLLA